MAVFLIFVLVAGQPDGGQADAGRPSAEQVMRDLQRSHIDANVPASADFENFLRRDLAAYFSTARKKKDVSVDYEPLRRGPTQSGVSYPKFYLWVRIASGKSSKDRGAVRIEAIDKKRFEVTDFMSEDAIRSAPNSIYGIFPAQVCEKIKEKVTP
jgi:hypothetical protein